jgi:hypothetical protein
LGLGLALGSRFGLGLGLGFVLGLGLNTGVQAFVPATQTTLKPGLQSIAHAALRHLQVKKQHCKITDAVVESCKAM